LTLHFFVALLLESAYKQCGLRSCFGHKRSPNQTHLNTGGKMADPNFNSAERMDIYRSMFLLNRGFHFIVQRLEHVGKIMMKDRDLRDMLGMTQEIQLEINTLVLNNLDSVENNDWAEFGKVRIALEKRLKTPPRTPRRKK
jgi:hypothetical protein